MSLAPIKSPVSTPNPFGRSRTSASKKVSGTKSAGMLFMTIGYTPIMSIKSDPEIPGTIIATAPKSPAIKIFKASFTEKEGSGPAMS